MKSIESINVFSKMRSLYRESCAPVCRKYRINQTNLDILLFLGQHPDYNTARDICEIRGAKTGIVSVAVEQLIQKGFLERRADEKDHRIQRLFLTPEAGEVVAEGKSVCAGVRDRVCAGITAEEMAVLDGIIKKLAQNLEKGDQEEL